MTADSFAPDAANPSRDAPLRNLRLAHHSLIAAALVLASGCLGISTRREPLIVLLSAVAVLAGLVVSLTAFDALHQQRAGDWLAGAALGLAVCLAISLRSRLSPLLVDPVFGSATAPSAIDGLDLAETPRFTAGDARETRNG
jgi:NADH:ubiquinone oxidoreductase subunit K